MAGIYIARMDDVSVSAAGLLLEVFAPATAALLIRRAKISAKGGTTGDQVEATLVRRTAAATGGTVVTPQPLGNYAAFGGTSRHSPTGGTTGVTLFDDGFNLLGPGWEWVPLDREGFIPVAPSSGVAVSLDTAPAAARNLFVSVEFQVID